MHVAKHSTINSGIKKLWLRYKRLQYFSTYIQACAVKCKIESHLKGNDFWNPFEQNQETDRTHDIVWYLNYSLYSEEYEIYPVLRVQGILFPDIALIANNVTWKLTQYQRLIRIIPQNHFYNHFCQKCEDHKVFKITNAFVAKLQYGYLTEIYPFLAAKARLKSIL